MAAYCCFNKLCQLNKSIKYSIESESYFFPYIVKLMKICYFAKFFRISLFTCLFEYSNMHHHVAFVFVQTEGFISFLLNIKIVINGLFILNRVVM